MANPALPPRQKTYLRKARWAHYLKVVFERYFPIQIDLDNKSLEEKFVLITEAYEILCGGKSAGRYDMLKNYTDNAKETSYNDKSYWEWWVERF